MARSQRFRKSRNEPQVFELWEGEKMNNQESKWQPIETANAELTIIALFIRNGSWYAEEAFQEYDEWIGIHSDYALHPIYWMPVPNFPKECMKEKSRMCDSCALLCLPAEFESDDRDICIYCENVGRKNERN